MLKASANTALVEADPAVTPVPTSVIAASSNDQSIPASPAVEVPASPVSIGVAEEPTPAAGQSSSGPTAEVLAALLNVHCDSFTAQEALRVAMTNDSEPTASGQRMQRPTVTDSAAEINDAIFAESVVSHVSASVVESLALSVSVEPSLVNSGVGTFLSEPGPPLSQQSLSTSGSTGAGWDMVSAVLSEADAAAEPAAAPAPAETGEGLW